MAPTAAALGDLIATGVGHTRLQAYGITHIECTEGTFENTNGAMAFLVAEQKFWDIIRLTPACTYPVRLVNLYADVITACDNAFDYNGVKWLPCDPLAIAFEILAGNPPTEYDNFGEPFVYVDHFTERVATNTPTNFRLALASLWHAGRIPSREWVKDVQAYDWFHPQSHLGWASLAVVPPPPYDAMDLERAVQITQYGWSIIHQLSSPEMSNHVADLRDALRGATTHIPLTA